MWSDLAKEMETGIVKLYAGPKYVGVGLEGGREEGDLETVGSRVLVLRVERFRCGVLHV